MIKVTETVSALAAYNNCGLKLWLTPGSTVPYWSNCASFKYDQVVATPYYFLAEAGYDAFADDDYENQDKITIDISPVERIFR